MIIVLFCFVSLGFFLYQPEECTNVFKVFGIMPGTHLVDPEWENTPTWMLGISLCGKIFFILSFGKWAFYI